MNKEAADALIEALRLLQLAAKGGGAYPLRNDEPRRLDEAIEVLERELRKDESEKE